MFSPTLQRALEDARSGKLDRAVADVRRVLTRQPRDIDAMLVLSILLMQSGQVEQAAHHLSRAVDLAPDSPQARSNYAGALMHLGRHAQAAEQLRRAVALAPGDPNMWMNLSTALLHIPDPKGAVDAAERGLKLKPGSPDISLNLATALQKLGKPGEGLDIAEKAHKANPRDARLNSVYLLMLCAAERSAESIAAAHREFGELHPTIGSPPGFDADPDRALRIGWLTGDFRTHSVAYFAEPLLEHGPAWVSHHVYSIRPDKPDPVTARMKQLSRAWRTVGHLDDAALDRMIREDRIDILIETSGHTADNRMLALAFKPAPIIISAIGYPNTTGLGAVDLRLVDSITDPPGSEGLAVERLLRIDPCFLCFRPDAGAPEPAMPDGPVTFGSFNASHKIGPATAAAWSKVLQAVPGSRLVLKSSDLRDAGEAVTARLGEAGIDTERIVRLPSAPTVREHLEAYRQIDVALDTVPYNGTTTTCEALWMGVPVVTLAGDRHAARVGASLLAAAGFPQWVAVSPEQFVRIAADLARDRDRLRQLRGSLRGTVRASALCDGAAYASRVYGALRDRWREACAGSTKQA